MEIEVVDMADKKSRSLLLKTDRPVGIIGYGAYIPQYRLPAAEIARVWGRSEKSVPIKEKAVPGLDEDTVTIGIEAARNALARAGIDPQLLRAVWTGSESHPYAVKPSSTIIAEAVGASSHIQAADLEFACKAGTEAMVMAVGLVGSGMGDYALALGVDTAQGKPGDALEYTAAAGGAAFVIGPADKSAVEIISTYSFVTDTPDFWRRAYQQYPEHGQRFTGGPAYFKHVFTAAKMMMDESGISAKDYAYAVFHQPNEKFPRRVAKQLGFTEEQIKTGLLSPLIGNTYAGASPVGLTAILDEAKPGDRILMVSYGSGAGSDALDLRATERISERREAAPKTGEYIARRVEIDYATYARYRGKLQTR
jgi:hydroxymethylglutaryl-CoA synthase